MLTRIEVSTGHGAGKPAQVQAAEWADLLAFAAHHTGLVPPEAADERRARSGAREGAASGRGCGPGGAGDRRGWQDGGEDQGADAAEHGQVRT